MMKKKILFAALLAALMAVAVSCGKNNPDGKSGGKTTAADVVGKWELTSVSTKAAVGSVDVSVYIDFQSGGTFVLYQKVGQGRYTRYEGTYSVGDDGALSGSYSGGKSWGPYTASVSGGTLVLSLGSEEDTYRKIDSIPSSVTENVY